MTVIKTVGIWQRKEKKGIISWCCGECPTACHTDDHVDDDDTYALK